MKGTLDWKSREVVNIFDETSLWSAPFGRLLLDNIPMKPKAQILDVGFGTGFPLVELAQRFGPKAKVYGMDIWTEAIKRCREKIKVHGLENVQLFEQSAEQIPLPDQSIDLICSNLGVNNFENKTQVLKSCHRVLREDGHLCICTNPEGTFYELFDLFQLIFQELQLTEAGHAFEVYLKHRDTKLTIETEMKAIGFELNHYVEDAAKMRFVDARAVLDHGLIRFGFLEYWLKIIPESSVNVFFQKLIEKIQTIISQKGEFRLSIPMLYMEFGKMKASA